MAQPDQRQFSFDAIAADSGGAMTGTIEIDHKVCIAMEVQNAGANALTGFSIQMRSHDDAQWFDYVEDADLMETASGFWFLKPEGLTELHTLGPGLTAHYGVHVVAGVALRFKITSASGTIINIKGTIVNQ